MAEQETNKNLVKKKFIGELWHLEPYRIIKENDNDELANFFLVLAVIYNDLKGITLFEKLIIDNYEQVLPTDEPSVHVGNFGGIFVQTRKIFISCLREFFEFLKENKKVLSEAEFKDILSKTNKDIEKRWNHLVDIALNNKSEDNFDFTEYLIKVRNNVASHYYQSGKELRKSFCNYFYRKKKINRNELAYYSAGENMEETRFFYADATVEEYLRSATGDIDGGFDIKYATEIGAIIGDINWTILKLLRAYLRNRPK